jgi:protease PrsW
VTTASSVRIVRISAGLACLFGAVVLIVLFRSYLLVFPVALLLAAALEIPLLAGGFGLIWLLHPVRGPSLRWCAAAIVWGATAAAACGIIANQGLSSLWAKTAGPRFAADWSDSLSAPLNEEVFKLCGVVLIVLAAPGVIRGPLDGFIYGAMSGLGFQVIENVTYGLNEIISSGATNPARAVIDSALVRAGASSLGSHWAMTAVGGAGIGCLVAGGLRGRPILIATSCVATAMGMHVLFDAPAPALPTKVVINLDIAAAVYLVLRAAYLMQARRLLADSGATGADGPATAVLSRRRRCQQRRRTPPGPGRVQLVAAQHELLDQIDEFAAPAPAQLLAVRS